MDARRKYWDVAKGLQEADGLLTSDYLEEVAEATVTGRYSLGEALDVLGAHYSDVSYGGPGADFMEADIVSARIVELLETGTFKLSPAALLSMHRRLFRDVFPYDWVGQWRTTNISRRQEVIRGRSVQYADHTEIGDLLSYEFDREKESRYTLPLGASQISRLARFTADVWQIHPFRDGNTRTISTFLIKYLSNLGIKVNNDPFAEKTDWFRNALVRYHYTNLDLGIESDAVPLGMFFENLLLDAGHDLDSIDLYSGRVGVSDS